MAVVGGGTVPVLHSGRKPHDIAGTDFFDGTAFTLHAATAGGDDEGLSQGMRVPGGAGSRLEGDAGTGSASGGGRLEQGVDAHGAGKPVRGTFHGVL